MATGSGFWIKRMEHKSKSWLAWMGETGSVAAREQQREKFLRRIQLLGYFSMVVFCCLPVGVAYRIWRSRAESAELEEDLNSLLTQAHRYAENGMVSRMNKYLRDIEDFTATGVYVPKDRILEIKQLGYSLRVTKCLRQAERKAKRGQVSDTARYLKEAWDANKIQKESLVTEEAMDEIMLKAHVNFVEGMLKQVKKLEDLTKSWTVLEQATTYIHAYDLPDELLGRARKVWSERQRMGRSPKKMPQAPPDPNPSPTPALA